MALLHFEGQDYEAIDFSTITLAEAIVLHDYSGLNLDQVEDAGFHAGVIAALIHISVARSNPSMPAKALKQKVLDTPMKELERIFEDISVEVPEEEPRPPASPSGTGMTPADEFATKNDASAHTPGGSGATGSEISDNAPPLTGSRGSGNGSGSAHQISETSPPRS